MRLAVALACLAAAVLAAPARGGAAETVRSGTAFFVSPSGYMITSGHVVAGCSTVPVWPVEGKEIPAKVVATSADPDLALLSTGEKTAEFAAVAGLDPPPAHADLATVGFGVLPHYPKLPVLSRGRYLGTEKTPSGRQVLIMDSAELPEGNSGGPVIDRQGALVGIVVGRLARAPEHGVLVSARDIARFLTSHGAGGLSITPPPEKPPAAAAVLYGISGLVQCGPDS